MLMQKSLGDKGLWIGRICLALAHFQFTIGQVTFTLKSLQSTIGAWVGQTSPLWVFAVMIWILFTPLVWVRRLEPFKYTYMFAVSMIALGVIATSVFAIDEIE